MLPHPIPHRSYRPYAHHTVSPIRILPPPPPPPPQSNPKHPHPHPPTLPTAPHPPLPVRHTHPRRPHMLSCRSTLPPPPPPPDPHPSPHMYNPLPAWVQEKNWTSTHPKKPTNPLLPPFPRTGKVPSHLSPLPVGAASPDTRIFLVCVACFPSLHHTRRKKKLHPYIPFLLFVFHTTNRLPVGNTVKNLTKKQYQKKIPTRDFPSLEKDKEANPAHARPRLYTFSPSFPFGHSGSVILLYF